MFHRVDSLADLDAPRFFRLVPQLVRYDGALRGALAAVYTSTSPSPLHDGITEIDDVRQTAALTNRDGFVGIEYTGG